MKNTDTTQLKKLQTDTCDTLTDLSHRDIRKETDSLGEVEVAAEKLWGLRLNDRSSISASAKI